MQSLSDSDNSDDFPTENNETKISDSLNVQNENIRKPRYKKGIIYISSIPKHMNVTQLRGIMQQFGEVGRIFLQPAESKSKKNKPAKHFTEGWVEFKKKRVAKQVALNLNNKQIDVRKKSRYYDCIWNIKYLSRFKWVHLSERLAYEKAVHKQRMRAEIAQAKKEATHFSLRISGSKKAKQKIKQNSVSQTLTKIPQRKPEAELTEKYIKPEDQSKETRTDFLKSIFS